MQLRFTVGSSKGFGNIVILLVIVALAAVGTAYYFGYDHGFEKSVKNLAPSVSPSSISDETAKEIRVRY